MYLICLLVVDVVVDFVRFWPGCTKDVKDWCQACDLCASRETPTCTPRAPLRTYNVGAPLERVALDILGPLPDLDHGNKYLLIIGDYFSKWTEAYVIPNQEATTVARVLVEEFVARFGIPRQIHSDQGRNFKSKVFQEMCKLLGMDKTRTKLSMSNVCKPDWIGFMRLPVGT